MATPQHSGTGVLSAQQFRVGNLKYNLPSRFAPNDKDSIWEDFRYEGRVRLHDDEGAEPYFKVVGPGYVSLDPTGHFDGLAVSVLIAGGLRAGDLVMAYVRNKVRLLHWLRPGELLSVDGTQKFTLRRADWILGPVTALYRFLTPDQMLAKTRV